MELAQHRAAVTGEGDRRAERNNLQGFPFWTILAERRHPYLGRIVPLNPVIKVGLSRARVSGGRFDLLESLLDFILAFLGTGLITDKLVIKPDQPSS